MIREVDLVSYLPEFLREYIELKKILDVQQPEVQLLEDLTEKLKDNQFILFADTQGIEKFEQMLKIQALDDDTLENRRSRIMSRWNNKIPYTVQILRNKLETLCGKDGYSLKVIHGEYRIIVRVNLINKKNFSIVKEMLEEVIPANMEIDLSLLYNQHGTLAKFTHKELAKYTHRQIREEVLSHVNENE